MVRAASAGLMEDDFTRLPPSTRGRFLWGDRDAIAAWDQHAAFGAIPSAMLAFTRNRTPSPTS
jgi:hypothetical protein